MIRGLRKKQKQHPSLIIVSTIKNIYIDKSIKNKNEKRDF